MKITITAIIERQRARLYTQKAKKIAKRFYIQKARHFSKARQFPLCFYIQKPIHLTLRDFDEILNLAFIYKKHDTLRYVSFLYINAKFKNFIKIP